MLKKLLDENREYSPVFGPGLSNHASMALIALDRLGGDDKALEKLFSHHATRLEPWPVSKALITEANFYNRLGDRDSFAAYLDFFSREAGEKDPDQVVTRFLPRLLPGVSGGAFHPLIRLAYGVMENDPAEKLFALSYWASDYTELGPIPEVSEKEFEPLEIFENLRMTAAPNYREPDGLIVRKLLAAAGTDGFAEGCTMPISGEDNLRRVAGAALWLYLKEPNFTTLHCVTAMHALRVLVPLIGEVYASNALAYAWQAICAAYISSGAPKADQLPAGGNRQDWEKARDVSLKSNDVHTIKLTFSCIEEFKVYNDSRYLEAAKIKALGE